MKNRLLLASVSASLAALSACGEPPLDREETISKMKILAVRAEEPDIHPGQVTRVHVLVASPSPTSFTTFIMPFSQDAAADFGGGRARFGSSGTAFNFFPGITQPVLPVDLGIPLATRAAPNFGTAYYQAPATIGTYTLAVFAREGAPGIGEFLGSPEKAQAAIQAQLESALKAFKSIRVRPLEDTLNKNPVVSRMTVDKRWAKVKEGAKKKPRSPAGFTMLPEETIRVKTQIEDENVDRASTVWWITAGEVAGYGRQDVDYKAPRAKGIVTLIALVLDREGGNNWYFQDVAVGVDSIGPDITDEKASSAYLALSGGRMQWLGFADDASAAVAVNQLNNGVAVVVAGTVTADVRARLGWYLANPVYTAAADDVTAPVMKAADVLAPPARPTPVLMRFDSLVAGRVRQGTGSVWSEPGESRAVVLQPAE